MARRPTILDVARRAGVSKGAVSFALNDRPGLAPATRNRILVAARELDWQPSSRARALSHSRAYAVGLVISRRPVLCPVLGRDREHPGPTGHGARPPSRRWRHKGGGGQLSPSGRRGEGGR